MTKANDIQIGGNHYRGDGKLPQHWDLMNRLRVLYTPGRFLAYIERHRDKKKREDLEKALHFAQKMVENADAEPDLVTVPPFPQDILRESVYHYIQQKGFDAFQASMFSLVLLEPKSERVVLSLAHAYLMACYPVQPIATAAPMPAAFTTFQPVQEPMSLEDELRAAMEVELTPPVVE